MRSDFDASRFIAEYRELGGSLVLLGDQTDPFTQWFGIIPPGRVAKRRARVRAGAMGRELASAPFKEDAVVDALRQESR